MRTIPISLLILLLASPLAAGAESVAVRTAVSDPELAETIRDGWFFRWFAPQHAGLASAVGPEASGDLEIVAERLPASARLRKLLAGLPVELDEAEIAFDGTRYGRHGSTLAVRVPDGERRSWVVVGTDPQAIAQLVSLVLGAESEAARGRMRGVERFDYLLRESRYLERRGFWRSRDGAEAASPIAVDRAREIDRIAERDRAWRERSPLAHSHLTLRVPPERRRDPELVALAAELDRAAAKMSRRLPLTLERPLQVMLEESFESLGRSFGIVAESVLPPPGGGFEGSELHLVHSPGDRDAFRFGVARALVRRAGIELPPWLADGAALWLSNGWYGQPYDTYLPALAAGRALPTAAELPAEERQRDGSQVLWPPVAAALIERLPGATLTDKLGRASGRAWVAGGLEDLERLPAPAPSPPSGRLSRRLDGISLAMSPGVENAYHGRGVDLQLARFSALGANAVSVMPYAFQRSPTDPAIRMIQGESGDENDTGLIHAARRAHARGFTVLWKPHIYVGGSWPGEIEMDSPEAWRAWWRVYRRYVLHHAVLARFAGAEIFSVGVELGRTVPLEAEWRELIAAVRLLYPGPLTYAGNWWGDFERVGFWDALDYVGVDAYFPLASEPSASREALADGARKAVESLAAAAARTGRPVLLTELGYAAQTGAWVAPHEEGGTYDEGHQSLAYEVFFEALGRPDWLAGVFLWKAYSHPRVDRGGPEPDFRFLSRAAEKPIREYFGGQTGAVAGSTQR